MKAVLNQQGNGVHKFNYLKNRYLIKYLLPSIPLPLQRVIVSCGPFMESPVSHDVKPDPLRTVLLSKGTSTLFQNWPDDFIALKTLHAYYVA